jgi:2-polyprenyl-6-methoxyphenol hydroxylase-like FAD-dependent oxidoreductase
MSDHQVIVVGAGPVGLWLAGELRLAGVSTLVVERDAAPTPHARALGIHPRTIEVLAMRGMAKQFLADGVRLPSWHFAMLANRPDFSRLDTPFPFALAFPQTRTTELFRQRAVDLGVRVVDGHTVTGLSQDDAGVTVSITGPDGPYTETAGFVVGCDGAGSTVRKAAGIEFPGTDVTHYGYIGDVTLDRPPAAIGTTLHGDGGALLVAPMPGGRFRVGGYDPTYQTPGDLTMDQLRAAAIRVAGDDFGMRDPAWLTRFGNATRVAAHYRAGRVLIAGDAAHMHFPAGGVGLNTGVQDAMNLGWKLAARIQGRGDDTLLDTYETERHPVGIAVSEFTLAQTELVVTTSAEGVALRTLLSDLIATERGFSDRIANRLSALDVAYPTPGAHPLVGTRVPDSDVFELLADGQPVLLDLSGETVAPQGIVTHRSDLAERRPEWAGVSAALIRPDGHVWAVGADAVSAATKF